MTTPRIDTQTLNSLSLRLNRSATDVAARLSQASQYRKSGGVVSGSTPVPTAKGLDRPTDKVDFSSLDESLKQLGPLLRSIAAASARSVGKSAEALNAAIQRAIQPYTQSPDGTYPSGVRGEWDTSLVLDSAVLAKSFPLGQTLDLNLFATGFDDQAGVLIELGSGHDADSALNFSGLRLEVAGNDGTASIDVGSAQTLGQIAAAINAHTSETGAVASIQSGIGLVIRSSGVGSDSFVSVKITDPGTLDTGDTYLGWVWGPEDEPRYQVSMQPLSAMSEITDYGNNLSVSINGTQAQRAGDYWVATINGVQVALDLDEDAISEQTLRYGEFAATLGTLRSSETRVQPDGTQTDFNSAFVTDSLLVAPGLMPGETLDLDFAFLEEPDAAGVFLDFGAGLDEGSLRAGSTLEIAGPDGSVSLSFVSGQSLSQIMSAINAVSSKTGVHVESTASGVGLVLRSNDAGPGAFVSVAAVSNDPTDFLTAYEVQGSSPGTAVVGEGVSLTSGEAFRDESRELTATINGQLAQFANGYWSVHLDSGVDLTIRVDEEAILAAGGAVNLGMLSKVDGLRSPTGPASPAEPMARLDPRDAGVPRLGGGVQPLTPAVTPSRPVGPTEPFTPYTPASPRTKQDTSPTSPEVTPSRPITPDGLLTLMRRLDLEA